MLLSILHTPFPFVGHISDLYLLGKVKKGLSTLQKSTVEVGGGKRQEK